MNRKGDDHQSHSKSLTCVFTLTGGGTIVGYDSGVRRASSEGRGEGRRLSNASEVAVGALGKAFVIEEHRHRCCACERGSGDCHEGLGEGNFADHLEGGERGR